MRATTPAAAAPVTAPPATGEPATGTSTGTSTGTGKGRPTPKRKVAQAANRRPLVPLDRKAAAREERARRRVQRDQEYRAMQSGDERFLPVRDRGPVRRFVRDSIDARRSLGEYFLPVAFVLLIAQTLLAATAPEVVLVLTLVLYLFILGTVVDAIILWRGLKKKLVARFGAEALPRGLTMYAVTRIFQLRRLRMPKPQVQRGQQPR
ncbi:hypothetical protein Cma02nite_00380 [Cellulomonas marina]|uniref:DUF3043 domain-containing protein n=1 Tax=Cellulomonas marina TaxID=988821 RepID=A0A1I0VZK5_9CELL|nr:hypothetical protein Cma02nite_00380 [Cellulomonas marina]SFA81859.1 Protein of unknown function [Cellulomonas marina]